MGERNTGVGTNNSNNNNNNTTNKRSSNSTYYNNISGKSPPPQHHNKSKIGSDMSKNKMIKNILTELKTAKKTGGGGGGKGGDSVTRTGRRYDRAGENCEEDEEVERSEDEEGDEEDDGILIRMKGHHHHRSGGRHGKIDRGEEAEDEEDNGEDEESGIMDYSESERGRFRNRRRSSAAYMNSSLKEKYGATVEMVGMKDYRRKRSGRHIRDNGAMDLSEVKNLLSPTSASNNLHNSDVMMMGGRNNTGSPNGWGTDKYGDEEDSANDEGTDLRSITGNSTGDDELPFRCGVCTYGSCDKSTLLRHMRTHSGERPFQCRLCYFAFTTKANCERHLRNRHGQIDRDELRNLVVCLPTSSNASESETEVVSNGGSCLDGNASPLSPPPEAIEPTNLVLASVESNRKRSEGASFPVAPPGFTNVEDRELPLDLSMDAVDLSTKSKNGNPAFRRKASLPRRRPPSASPPEQFNSNLNYPYIPKRESLGHPEIPRNPFSQHPIVQPTPILAHPSHPAFNLFYFGAPSGINPFAMQPSNVEKLITLSPPSPLKLPTTLLSSSGRASFESVDVRSDSDKDVDVHSEPIVEVKKSGSNAKSATSTVSPTSNNRKRSGNSNSEYQKPKQRRYRTERPFACPHCPARFTLRSNMERHGKHQHPTVWQRSPSNRVINRQKNQQLSPLVGPPTLVPSSKYGSVNGSVSDIKEKSRELGLNVRAVIAQQLKRKLSNSSLRNNNNGSETETDPENTPVSEAKISGGDSTSDLASVSQLLDRVKSSNFAQYFNEAENVRSNDENNSEDDGEGDESGDEVMSSEEGDSKISSGEKKKSAYSSAPHKISCPHCTRRFPWTSSLRRHLLTHTGQKPYQCSKCPLLFTTKSNCDRHLARKHGGGSSKIVSDSNNSSEEDDGEVDPEDEDNENENENENEEDEDSSSNHEQQSTPIPAVQKVSPVATTTAAKATNGSATSSPGEDAAFRCHLCEAAAGEREALLAHMEEQHKETFHMLVSKGALSSSPPSENSENEQVPLDQRDVTHRKVMCVFCVRRFWSVEDLRRHIRSHSGERPFSCPHCSRRFTLKHSMLRHLKKHSASTTPSRKLAKGIKDQITNSRNGLARGSNCKNEDLIGRLLGLNDEKLVEKLLSQPDAKDAAKLLGIASQQHNLLSSTRASSKVT